MSGEKNLFAGREGLCLPDYRHGIISVAGSWMEALRVKAPGAVDPQVTCWLRRHAFRQIIVLLIDGMGSRILRSHLSQEHFLRRAMLKEVTTVYPSTTAAATTSILTGLSPMETGWIGWHQYFRELDDSVILFLNRSRYGRRSWPGFSDTALPVRLLPDQLAAQGKTSRVLFPAFRPGGAHDFDELCCQIEQTAQDRSVSFVYAYWDQFDTLMHQKGPSFRGVGDELRRIDHRCALLAERLPQDCGLIIIADHGQVDVHSVNLAQDEELRRWLTFPVTVEARAAAFHLKPGCYDRFEHDFNQRFSSSFLLAKSETLLRSGLFGEGQAHPRTAEFLGDAFAVGLGDLTLDWIENEKIPFRGQHAGLREEEMWVPVILSPGFDSAPGL